MQLENRQYYPYFDWMRGLLAMIVLFHHSGLLKWDQSGNLAVQVFFALSGWLIGANLLKLSIKDLPRFYFNRAIRIWAPYYVALLLLLLASLLHDDVTGKWLEFVLYKLTFVWNLFGTQQLSTYLQDMPLQGTGNHFWSVNAEEQFYLLAPILLILCNRRVGQNIITWILIALIAWLSKTYASIVFGVLAAVIAKRYGEFQEQLISKIFFILLLILSVIGLFYELSYELISPFCAISIILLSSIKGQQSPAGKLVGGASYSLYLNQWIGGVIVHSISKHYGFQNSIITITAALVLSIGIAVTLYWLVDRPLLIKRNYLYTDRLAFSIMIFGYLLTLIGLTIGIYIKYLI